MAREAKRFVVPSEAAPSELGFTRELKDGGDEKEVTLPGRKEESAKLRKSEDVGAQAVLLALVNSRP